MKLHSGKSTLVQFDQAGKQDVTKGLWVQVNLRTYNNFCGRSQVKVCSLRRSFVSSKNFFTKQTFILSAKGNSAIGTLEKDVNLITNVDNRTT